VGVLELRDHPLDNGVVPVVASQVVVTTGGLDFHHSVTDFQQRNVEGSTTEVEDQNRLLGLTLVEPVRQRR